MRDWSLRLFCVLFVTACSSTPAITVVRLSKSEPAEDVRGDPIKLKRGAQDQYAGARGGFYVIRDRKDWDAAFPENNSPPEPPGLGRGMLFFAVAESLKVTELKIERAIETEEMLYVWVKQTRTGEHCTNKASERAYDAVSAPRIEKPTKFFVATERGESCGAAPEAKVECRLKDQKEWAPKVTAQPSDVIECELTGIAKSRYEVVDRVMEIELPPGSTAKLKFPKGPTRAELTADVYGTYVVKGEAADELGRRGKAAATVEVKPPRTRDVLVQLVWGGFELTDQPDSFPRANLRVADEGPKGQRCSADIAVPGLCEVKTRGPYMYMRIPEGKRNLVVSVQYLDERPEKGPAPCIHVWFDGNRTAETCDHQRRAADEIWKIGTLDTGTGKLTLEPPASSSGAPPAASAPPPAASSSATPAPKKKK